MDPKQALTKRSGQALGWLCQKLISQGLVPVVEVQNADVKTLYRHSKAERDRFRALHNLKVKSESLKKEY